MENNRKGKALSIGVIGYGVRIDMLMDEFAALPFKVELKAVADKNPARVRAVSYTHLPGRKSRIIILKNIPNISGRSAMKCRKA